MFEVTAAVRAEALCAGELVETRLPPAPLPCTPTSGAACSKARGASARAPAPRAGPAASSSRRPLLAFSLRCIGRTAKNRATLLHAFVGDSYALICHTLYRGAEPFITLVSIASPYLVHYLNARPL